MKRALLVVLAVGVLLLAVGAGVYFIRTRAKASGSPPQAVQKAMPDMPAGNPAVTSTPPTTPRGDVTIDPRRQQLIGVKTVAVVRQTIDQNVRATGAVRYDETKQADVNVKTEGWIRDLYVDYTGQQIQRGQPLFSLYSPDLLNTQNEYLLALKTRDLLQQSTIADARERADALVASARQRLLAWDLPAADLQKLDETRRAVDAVVFRAPVSGFVVEKMAVKGLHVMPGQSLYKVSDISVVWVEADVYESELAAVKVGDAATVTVDAYPGDPFTGRVIYIYPYLDDKTRTNKVRVQLANRGGRLKPGMYAHVEVTSRGRSGLVVPTNAVLDSGTEQVVFIAQGDGRFQPQKVKIGRRLGDSTEILDGLKEGEQVAIGATFFLDSESQLRASLQGYEASAAPTGAAAPAGTQITFRTVPDPPKTGDNQLEATVKDAGGKPIDDAEVTVQFFMPAMPTMNMPAMKSDAKLAPAGGGVYRGSGQVMMAGRWDATVTVVRGGQRLGTKQLPVVAR
jgi:Cu(I)/Ag(I) efflux system membrane fusion protein/cobalt-zinc-cadmium efflux system membrane fusion protein